MKWLTVKGGVYLNEKLLAAAEQLDPFYEDLPSIITSGFRSAAEQLELINEKMKRHGIKDDTWTLMYGNKPEVMVALDGVQVFWWQSGWSKVLGKQDLINPPLPAAVLYDYIDPDTKENKKGKTIEISSHQKGRAFDVGGGDDLMGRAERGIRAMKSGKVSILNARIEHVNSCIHFFV